MEFYRGKIPHGKISVKILRRNFYAPYYKNRRKIGVKSRQDRRKILCKARINAKSANFTLKKSCGKISPSKAR